MIRQGILKNDWINTIPQIQVGTVSPQEQILLQLLESQMLLEAQVRIYTFI